MLSTIFMLEGQVPSKKNSRQIFAKHGRIVNIPSKRYKEWHDLASKQLEGFGSLKPPYEIVMVFWMQNNRRADLDNKMASILDLLQDCGIIEDDCWQKLRSIKAKVGGISKDAPRVKIEIYAECDNSIDRT